MKTGAALIAQNSSPIRYCTRVESATLREESPAATRDPAPSDATRFPRMALGIHILFRQFCNGRLAKSQFKTQFEVAEYHGEIDRRAV